MRMILFAAAAALAVLALTGPARAGTAFAACADAGDFPELAGSQCLRAAAPLDHAAADGPEIELFVRKFPATGARRGEVWLVAGGPGETGAAFYPFLDVLRAAFPGFDLVIPDHRGTGYSTKLCPVEEAPDSADGIALAGDEWGGCIGTMFADPARTGAFSITNAARDLSGLIATYRGAGPVYLYGVSYGTQLALRTLAVAPPVLDGLILDSLVPPETTEEWDLSRRSAVVDRVGRAVLTADDLAAYEALLATIPPELLAQVPGGDLRRLFGTLLDFPALRARLPALIADLAAGRTAVLNEVVAGLEEVGGLLNRYPQSPSSLPLVMLISGSENNPRPDLTAATVAAEAQDLLFTSPLPGFLVDPPAPLYARDAAFGRPPANLPPTLVLHGTRDPKTPYEGALAHIALLAPAGPVALSAVEGAPHFILFTAPDCFTAAVGAFVAGEPAPGTCVLDP